jgi:hypothetical protein
MAAVAPTTDSDDEETRHNRMHTNTTSAIDEAMGAIGRELLRDAEEEELPSDTMSGVDEEATAPKLPERQANQELSTAGGSVTTLATLSQLMRGRQTLTQLEQVRCATLVLCQSTAHQCEGYNLHDCSPFPSLPIPNTLYPQVTKSISRSEKLAARNIQVISDGR